MAKWIGIISHAVLGFLFPYVFVGGIILVYGFMSPPTPDQRVWGITISALYLLAFIAANLLTLRRLPPKSFWARLLLHAAIWFISCTISFAAIRFLQ